MSLKVRTNEGKELTLDILPDHCPFCHVSILPKVVFGYHYNVDIDVLMACPKSSCKKSFIAYYTYKHNSNGLAQYAKKLLLGMKKSEVSVRISKNYLNHSLRFSTRHLLLNNISFLRYAVLDIEKHWNFDKRLCHIKA